MMINNLLISETPNISWISSSNIDAERLESEFYKIKYIDAMEKIQNSNGTLLNDIIEEVKDGPGGWGIQASDYVSDGVPMLRGVNIKDGLLEMKDCVFITEEKQKELKRSKVVRDDVLLAVRGSIGVGKSAVYSLDKEANINAAVVKITVNRDKIDPYYLSCFFNSRYGRLQMERISNGVNQQNTNLTEVKSNIIPIPSPEIQKYIVDKVRKAEELREEAKKLSQQAEYDLLEVLSVYDDKEDESCKYHWLKVAKINDRIDADFYQPKFNVLDRIEEKVECLFLEDIISEKYTGKTPDFTYDFEDGIPLLAVKNVEENRLNVENVERKIKDNSILKKTVEEDIIVTRVGSVGVVTCIEKYEEGLFITDNVICLKLVCKIPKRYICFI